MESSIPEEELVEYLFANCVDGETIEECRERLETDLEEWFYAEAQPNGIVEDELVISSSNIYMMQMWNAWKGLQQSEHMEMECFELKKRWCDDRIRRYPKTYEGHPERVVALYKSFGCYE